MKNGVEDRWFRMRLSRRSTDPQCHRQEDGARGGSCTRLAVETNNVGDASARGPNPSSAENRSVDACAAPCPRLTPPSRTRPSPRLDVEVIHPRGTCRTTHLMASSSNPTAPTGKGQDPRPPPAPATAAPAASPVPQPPPDGEQPPPAKATANVSPTPSVSSVKDGKEPAATTSAPAATTTAAPAAAEVAAATAAEAGPAPELQPVQDCGRLLNRLAVSLLSCMLDVPSRVQWNIIVSPIALTSALASLVAGCEGPTKEDLCNLLRLKPQEVEVIVERFKASCRLEPKQPPGR
ncbi:translation initiation factor IF-2 [Rhipicephalus sanguineus]|uniref:translation initiation factor IF-2 n=1 Tax=Rhipicephalus sanguineus TaxID=34632 RepID=UPI0020C503DD|nr:translation initiation factor IF-2 [Rhipicephalus sanguineus]